MAPPSSSRAPPSRPHLRAPDRAPEGQCGLTGSVTQMSQTPAGVPAFPVLLPHFNFRFSRLSRGAHLWAPGVGAIGAVRTAGRTPASPGVGVLRGETEAAALGPTSLERRGRASMLGTRSTNSSPAPHRPSPPRGSPDTHLFRFLLFKKWEYVICC